MKVFSMLVVFVGRGIPIGHAEGFVSSKADGTVISAVPRLNLPDGGELQAPCQTAHFETVVLARNQKTVEAGRVSFPEIDSYLDVYTPETGLVVGLSNGYEAGSISWHVREGGGLFAGASGIVTGNFIGNPDGTFVDHQFFKLILQEG